MKDKNRIFQIRKELKKKSHTLVKTHYLVLFFLTLVMALLGSDLALSGLTTGKQWGKGKENEADSANIFSFDDIIVSIARGNLQEGETISERRSEDLREKAAKSKSLGLTNGVLAQVMDFAWSGKAILLLGGSILGMTHSPSMAGGITILVFFLLSASVTILFSNVYAAVLRRIYLEARIYEKVPLRDALFIKEVHRWMQAVRVMLVKDFYEGLWWLTVIGGFIKSCSYFAVPYIVAENPSISAKEAITLSRRMMDGHKMEFFKYDLTLIGWMILGNLTLGFSDYFYGLPYRYACQTEFYALIREDAIRRGVEGIEALNDPWLYEKADRILLYETYFDVVDEITILHENRKELKGYRKVLAERFGIWWGSLEEKKNFEEMQSRGYAIENYRLSMDGKAYPQWLNPLWQKKEIGVQAEFSFMRYYSVWSLFLMFIGFSVIGWAWEVSLHFVQTGEWANRGAFIGPWLPIYGTGGMMVLLLCSQFRKKPMVEFVMSMALCGVLEYFTAWYLETRFHQKWWSYDGYFLNLHGRICAEGLLVFGVGCCLVVYMGAPTIDYQLSKIKKRILIGVCVVLAVLFGVDLVHTIAVPNMAKGAIEEEAEETVVSRYPAKWLGV